MRLISNILLILWLISFIIQLIAHKQGKHKLRHSMTWVGLVFASVNIIIGVIM